MSSLSPKARPTEHVQSQGLEPGQVAPNVTLHRPCTQMGGGDGGRTSELETFENRQMHAFYSERGSSPLLLSEHGCVI